MCKEDRFCPGGGANLTIVCPDGKYSLPGSDDPTDCYCPDYAFSKQNAKYVTECICQSGYFKEYNSALKLGGWGCSVCLPNQVCYNNTNTTCPVHASSFGAAKSYVDCWCNPGYKNSTTGGRTELNFCEDCTPNYFCTGKGAMEACVAHAVSPVQSMDSNKCFCDWGYKGVNNSACVACQSPTYCYAGLEAQCSEGTFSVPLSWDRLNCSCIPGRWGPSGDTSQSENESQKLFNWEGHSGARPTHGRNG